MKYAVSKKRSKSKKKKVGENVIYVRVHLSVREMLFLIECNGFTFIKKKKTASQGAKHRNSKEAEMIKKKKEGKNARCSDHNSIRSGGVNFDVARQCCWLVSSLRGSPSPHLCFFDSAYNLLASL